MHKDALSVALVAESISSPSRSRRIASLLLINAIKSGSAQASEDEIIRYVEERASADVAREARALAEELGI